MVINNVVVWIELPSPALRWSGLKSNKVVARIWDMESPALRWSGLKLGSVVNADISVRLRLCAGVD